MNIKTFLSASLIAFAVVINSPSQGVTDLSSFEGVWVIDKKGTRQDRALEISVRENTVMIKETVEKASNTPIVNLATLFIDGRGEKNLLQIRGAETPSEIISRTEFKKGKLIRQSTFTTVNRGVRDEFVADHREWREFSLSKDGSSLKVGIRTTLNDRSRNAGSIPSQTFVSELTYQRQK